ncbi:hypothetical protein BSKO_03743 [Bryopsis sp. KO-2023]|nr:hypothetical protein BSKO_03743 [Bryopsis sp. KO-2023]
MKPVFSQMKAFIVPDVAPLVFAITTALGLGVYGGYHAITSSPECMLDKEARNDQVAESDWFEKRTEKYSHSIFRRLAEGGWKHVFPNDDIAGKPV